MKKLTALILALMMACMMIPAMAAEDAAGEWYLSSMSSGGVTMDATMLTSFGMTGVLTLEADGSMKMAISGQDDITGTWAADGDKVILTIAGQAQECTLADGTLTMIMPTEGGDTTMAFSREAPGAAYTPAEVKTDAKLEDFAGSWGVKYIGVNGMVLDLDVFAATMAAMFGAENAEIPDVASSMAVQIEGNTLKIGAGTDDEQTVEATFADGKLTATNPADQGAIEIVLLQDGMLCMKASQEGQEEIVYFVPVTAEAAPAN